MGRQLCTNKAPVVNEQINQQNRWGKKNKRKKKKSQGEMKENMKKKKEPNLMESMA